MEAKAYDGLSSRQAIRRLIGQSGLYGAGQALQKVGAFILLPFYISRLSPDEYGQLALISMLPAILPAIFSLGLPNTITRYYHEWIRQDRAPDNLGVVWTLGTGSALAFTVLVDQAGGPVMNHLLTQVQFEPYIRLGLWWAFFSSLSLYPLALFRIREQSLEFVLVSLVTFFVGVGLNIWVVLAGGGLIGILWVQVIAAACIGLALSGWFLTEIRFRMHGPSIARALHFALPLVPSATLEALSSRADRFFLDKFVPLTDIAVYSFANQIGQAVKFFYDSVKPAWVPFYIRVAAERKDARIFLGRFITLYVAAIVFVAMVVLLVAPDIVQLLAEGTLYVTASPLLAILVAAYFLQGLTMLGSLAVQVAERTAWQPIVQLLHFVFVIIGNIWLTQWLGLYGAALSLLLTSGILAGLYLILGQRAYPVSLEGVRLLGLLSSSALIAGTALSLPQTGIIVKVALLAVLGLLAGGMIVGGRPIGGQLIEKTHFWLRKSVLR